MRVSRGYGVHDVMCIRSSDLTVPVVISLKRFLAHFRICQKPLVTETSLAS